jgi:hypothetical protein
MASFDQKQDYHELLMLWHQALAEPLGIVVCTPNPLELRDDLYEVRAAEADPTLSALEIRMAPTQPGDIWLVHTIREPDKALMDQLSSPPEELG